jgi:hypothetical protein
MLKTLDDAAGEALIFCDVFQKPLLGVQHFLDLLRRYRTREPIDASRDGLATSMGRDLRPEAQCEAAAKCFYAGGAYHGPDAPYLSTQGLFVTATLDEIFVAQAAPFKVCGYTVSVERIFALAVGDISVSEILDQDLLGGGLRQRGHNRSHQRSGYDELFAYHGARASIKRKADICAAKSYVRFTLSVCAKQTTSSPKWASLHRVRVVSDRTRAAVQQKSSAVHFLGQPGTMSALGH